MGDLSSQEKEWPGPLHVPATDDHAGGVNSSGSTVIVTEHARGKDVNNSAPGARAPGSDTDKGPDTNETDMEKTEEQETRPRQAAGRRELRPDECPGQMGWDFPEWKKWWILTVIFLVQTSMNFNTSLYSNGIGGIAEEFGVSEQAARAGAAIFLITYAFGCELWAPWSEEVGRKIVLQLSLGLVNLWAIPVAVAPNFATVLVGRALGGLSTAGGSVTLGMIADMFGPHTQQHAVAYIVFSSVGGSILGPIVGGFVEQYLHWRWTIWIQLIFGGAVQILHWFTVPETRSTSILTRIAKERREVGQDPNVYGPDEMNPLKSRFAFKELMSTWYRPFHMFFTEPIVLWLSLLSGFSDALIFMCIQSFQLVYRQWQFSPSQIGLSFIPIGIGYVIAWSIFLCAFKRHQNLLSRVALTEHLKYESRMTLLLYLAPCLPIGLIIFGWTSSGPPLHWIGTMVGSAIIGIANYAIYMATIDYMICAYGPYAASATGGNGWARDFLAGVLTVPAIPFYSNIGAEQGRNLEYASTILFCISLILVLAVYAIYFNGPTLRTRSPFAQNLKKEAQTEEQVLGVPTHQQQPSAVTPSATATRPSMRIAGNSRHSSYYASREAESRANSRANSRVNSRDNSVDEERQPVQNLMPIVSVPTQQVG